MRVMASGSAVADTTSGFGGGGETAGEASEGEASGDAGSRDGGVEGDEGDGGGVAGDASRPPDAPAGWWSSSATGAVLTAPTTTA